MRFKKTPFSTWHKPAAGLFVFAGLGQIALPAHSQEQTPTPPPLPPPTTQSETTPQPGANLDAPNVPARPLNQVGVPGARGLLAEIASAHLLKMSARRKRCPITPIRFYMTKPDARCILPGTLRCL